MSCTACILEDSSATLCDFIEDFTVFVKDPPNLPCHSHTVLFRTIYLTIENDEIKRIKSGTKFILQAGEVS